MNSHRTSSASSAAASMKVLLSMMLIGFFVIAIFSFTSGTFHTTPEYDHDRAIKKVNIEKKEKLFHLKIKQRKREIEKRIEIQTSATTITERRVENDDVHAATIEAGTNKKVWDEYSFSNSQDKEQLHPEQEKKQKISTEKSKKIVSPHIHQNAEVAEDYRFELDRPRAPDEAAFFHLPKSQGGHLHPLPSRPAKFINNEDDDEITKKNNKKLLQKSEGESVKINSHWSNETFNCAEYLHKMFSMYDENETAVDSIAVYGTMCVGSDCEYIIPMIAHLDVAIGHFIVVLSSSIARFVDLFSSLMKQFPGRFTYFHRPDKLSCAESWNLVVRMGFARVKPMPDQIFIANADWRATTSNGRFPRNMARFLEFSRRNLDKVVNRYYHFSSFAFTKKGYLELGYFDEVIYPALAEDVEFHIKAVSKGMGELGLYDQCQNGSKHIKRASAGEKTIQKRHGSVARFDYILRKWGVRVPAHSDFAHARPFRHPFNLPWLHHNNSWVVDPAHRACAKTGEGRKMLNSKRCYYDARVLMKLFPEEGLPGIGGAIIGRDEGVFRVKKNLYQLPASLTTDKDSFPGPYH